LSPSITGASCIVPPFSPLLIRNGMLAGLGIRAGCTWPDRIQRNKNTPHVICRGEKGRWIASLVGHTALRQQFIPYFSVADEVVCGLCVPINFPRPRLEWALIQPPAIGHSKLGPQPAVSRCVRTIRSSHKMWLQGTKTGRLGR
jgi:hypothetical protein